MLYSRCRDGIPLDGYFRVFRTGPLALAGFHLSVTRNVIILPFNFALWALFLIYDRGHDCVSGILDGTMG